MWVLGVNVSVNVSCEYSRFMPKVEMGKAGRPEGRTGRAKGVGRRAKGEGRSVKARN